MVISPDNCPLTWAGGEISCTEDMHDWPGCSAANFVADEDGPHYIMVTVSSCSTEDAPYIIGVDAGTDPNLTLIADDIMPFRLDTIEHAVTATATVSE